MNRLLLTAAVLFALPATAATWRVEKDGSGDFTVLQDAADAAAAGDTILVGSGRYDDFRLFTYLPSGLQNYSVLGISTDSLTIVGVDSTSVILGPAVPVDYIDGLDVMAVTVNHLRRGMHFRNLTLENCRWGADMAGDGSFGSCLFRNASWSSLLATSGVGVSYRRCRFQDADVSILASDPIQDIVIEECVIGPGSWLNLKGVDNALVQDCIFVGNAGALQFESGTDGLVRRVRVSGSTAYDVRVSLGASMVLEQSILEGGGVATVSIVEANALVSRTYVGPSDTYSVLVSLSAPSPSQDVRFNQCDVLNGGGYSVRVNTPIGIPRTLDFTDNYWGSTDSAQIGAWIYDNKDEPGWIIADVVYEPIRSSRVATQPRSLSSLKSLFAPRRP